MTTALIVVLVALLLRPRCKHERTIYTAEYPLGGEECAECGAWV